MATMDGVHNWVDGVPDDQLNLAASPVHKFVSAGALSAEHDLAERVEDVLRIEDGT